MKLQCNIQLSYSSLTFDDKRPVREDVGTVEGDEKSNYDLQQRQDHLPLFQRFHLHFDFQLSTMILSCQSPLLLILKQVTENYFRLISFWYQSQFSATSAQLCWRESTETQAPEVGSAALVGRWSLVDWWRVCLQQATFCHCQAARHTYYHCQARHTGTQFADPPENLNLLHVSNLPVLD